MKNFKALFLTFIAVLVVFSLFTVQSCKKKITCADIQCMNGGTCVNAKCSCPPGWVGDRCQQFDAGIYIKNYNATDNSPTCSFAPETYTTSITKLGGDTVEISRISSLVYQSPVKAIIDGNVLNVYTQSSNGVDISGTGTMGDGAINWQYTCKVFGFDCAYTGVWN